MSTTLTQIHEDQLNRMQSKINEVSRQLIKERDKRRDARSHLYHLANHIGEYSREQLKRQMLEIAEDTLGYEEV